MTEELRLQPRLQLFKYKYCLFWSWDRESNPGPTDYESVALPSELFQHKNNYSYSHF